MFAPKKWVNSIKALSQGLKWLQLFMTSHLRGEEVIFEYRW